MFKCVFIEFFVPNLSQNYLEIFITPLNGAIIIFFKSICDRRGLCSFLMEHIIYKKSDNIYFRITFLSDLTYTIYLRLDIGLCVGGGVEYLTFDILLQAQSEEKVVGN